MVVIHNLLKEQIFFRRELQERVAWFIRLRWIVGGAALAACFSAGLSGLDTPLFPIAAIGLCVLLYNGVFSLLSIRMHRQHREDLRHSFALIHGQIVLDLGALCLAIHFTGGIDSPLLILVMFHVVLASILLPGRTAFSYAAFVLLAVGMISAFQEHSTALLMKTNDDSGLLLPRAGLPGAVLVRYLLFAGAILFSTYAITSVRAGLRSKARGLLSNSKELDETNAKLTSLYEMVKEMDSITSLKKLMDTATRQAAAIMGVKACSIKLLDEQRRYLEFASTYGLSEDYLSMGRLSLDKSPINRGIIDGTACMIGNISERDHFQYPENIEKEGITSMLCLPLKGNHKVLGVFCVYGMEDYCFVEKDLEFFGLMSDLTGIAIERIKWDLTKSWFLAKVTHNLRSPLNGIYSMVTLVRKGYLGPLNERQTESLLRSESRIRVLSGLIGDLLKLGRERTEMGKSKLRPIAPESVLQPLIPIFRDQAKQKGIEINFGTADHIPKVPAGEELLEDIFVNLIANAIKYTPHGGHVRVELSGEETEGTIRFSVCDTGIGIPEDDMPGLFSEFFRAANAKEFAGEGTGLGLAIVKEILDRLGGKIDVTSKVGQGTQFTCHLPGCLDRALPDQSG